MEQRCPGESEYPAGKDCGDHLVLNSSNLNSWAGAAWIGLVCILTSAGMGSRLWLRIYREKRSSCGTLLPQEAQIVRRYIRLQRRSESSMAQ